MKKVLLTALFLGAFVSANAVELDGRENCHSYACGMVESYESNNGGELSLEDADAIYDMAYESC
ncbi:hypothetical protein LNI90_10705 [Tenacibaculum dicentrarchi]|uniref:Uncharacterized protein n=2 Tax=Tenacibaculum finnmarkense TaxID=2781243 RepID=A0A2I2M7M9_9FLAO|nr:hypothetical protein [Tenacibaculum finnmarkense]MCD8406082.1 hypothetical protein [Tenacibaculum dicentrarchi]MBE7634691.1 hypothetical protein [Tenacibaculum finnmarkense genomovar ulcerans]MBE7646602.1 hypothetical protein [Tenacibaculum finnmarkense genomovar ulcerans]MBE7653417.1 hypothetical protein [Tenacibaculum finnmarkense genomovar finnmarkense]MBE7693512.1 hypothetical protein [Tenacibaculum finnmarkense genomovar finnmarkense]